MLFVLSLLFSASIVAAAPHSAHYGAHRARHAAPTSPAPKRDTLGSLQRMSSAEVMSIYKTCWNGALQWPLPNQPNPVVDVVSQQLSIFERPASTPHTLTVHNYCDYDIQFTHFNGGSSPETGCLSAGTSIDRPLAGTVFKAAKSASMGNDLLIEYSIDANGVLWYNLSLLTCMVNGDTSACAGHEAGLQLSNPGKMAFQCGAGTWCDDQAYLYHENLCKKQNPVCLGSPQQGLTMEFCASKKP